MMEEYTDIKHPEPDLGSVRSIQDDKHRIEPTCPIGQSFAFTTRGGGPYSLAMDHSDGYCRHHNPLCRRLLNALAQQAFDSGLKIHHSNL